MTGNMLSSLSSKLTALLVPALAGTLFALSSCTPQATPEEEEEMITLSESEVVFANNGGSKDITVGGAETWDFISSEGETGWVKIAKNGNTLSVNATPNLDGTERSASVLVVGKSSTAKFSVKQSAADFILDFSEAEVTFPAAGGDKIIVVNANSNEWSFDPIPEEVTWLTVSGGKEIVTLTAMPNTGTDAREASLTVTSGSGEKRELLVTQTGVAKYFLPYMPAEGQAFRNSNLITFEESRGNVLVSYGEPAYYPDWGLSLEGVISFITSSPVVAFLDYVTAEVGQPIYSHADLYITFADPENPVEADEFVAFLKENGYTATNDKDTEFANEAGTVNVTISANTATDGIIASFIPFVAAPEQPGEMPTFDKIPEGLEGVFPLVNDPAKKQDAVEALEEAAGGTMIEQEFSEVNTELVVYENYETGKTDKLEPQLRDYFFGDVDSAEGLQGSLSEYHLYFYDPSVGYWKNGNKWVMSNEFAALLEEEGYVFSFENQGLGFYLKSLNDTEDHVLAVGPASYSNVNEGAEIVIMAHFIWAKEEATSLKANFRTLMETKDFKNARNILVPNNRQALIDHVRKTTARLNR